MMNCEYWGYAMIFTLHFINLVTLKYVYLENKIQRNNISKSDKNGTENTFCYDKIIFSPL